MLLKLIACYSYNNLLLGILIQYEFLAYDTHSIFKISYTTNPNKMEILVL